jgi:hypothetical protein
MEPDLTSAQKEVQQKVGRNLMRLQYMERMLKFLLALSVFEAPLSKFQTEFASHIKKISRLPMGYLVGNVAKGVFLPKVVPAAPDSQAVKEITMRFEFGLEDSGHLMKEWRRQQKEIVRERNKLVHRFLDDCDLSTIQGCQAASFQLDHQRERMISAGNSIESLVNAVKESFEDMKAGNFSNIAKDN